MLLIVSCGFHGCKTQTICIRCWIEHAFKACTMATNYASIITFCLISTFFLQDKGPITTAGVLLRHPSVIFMSPADNIKGQKSETASTQHQSDQEEKGHAKVREEDWLWTVARRFAIANSAIELPNSDPLALNFEDTCTLFLQHHTQPCRALWSAFEINDFHFYHFFLNYEGHREILLTWGL